MSLFLLQDRNLKLASSRMPSSFPALVTARITLVPEDAFGVPGPGPRSTAQRARPATLKWNAYEGVSHWEAELIEKVEAVVSLDAFSARLDGNLLTLSAQAASLGDASRMLTSASQFLPALLSFRLRTFVWIKAFEVTIGESGFRFEISSHRFGITIATAEHNKARFLEAINEWLKKGKEYRRLISAFYYYRHAQRLAALEPDRQSTAAEVILNLTKALEVVFTSDRDRLRNKAKAWGFDMDTIEQRIIPLFLIRNEIDVAHASLAPFSGEEKKIILDFINSAMVAVHDVLGKLAGLVKDDKIVLDPPSESMDKEKRQLLGKLKGYLPKE